jgi:hypothetical protein
MVVTVSAFLKTVLSISALGMLYSVIKSVTRSLPRPEGAPPPVLHIRSHLWGSNLQDRSGRRGEAHLLSEIEVLGVLGHHGLVVRGQNRRVAGEAANASLLVDITAFGRRGWLRRKNSRRHAPLLVLVLVLQLLGILEVVTTAVSHRRRLKQLGLEIRLLVVKISRLHRRTTTT